MNEIVIKNGVGTPLAGFLIGLCSLVALIFIFVTRIYEEANNVFLISVLLPFLPVGLWKLVDRRVQLKINESGVYCVLWGVSCVTWDRVESIEIRSDKDRYYVCVVPAESFWSNNTINLEEFNVKSLNSIKKCLKINNFYLGVDFDRLKQDVESYFKYAKN